MRTDFEADTLSKNAKLNHKNGKLNHTDLYFGDKKLEN